MTGFVELWVDQGTSFNNVINLADDLTGTPINVSAYEIYGQVKKSYYSQNVATEIVCAKTDPQNGEVTLFIPSTETANLFPGKYVFDVTAIDEENTTIRILEGIIIVSPGVTGLDNS